MKEKLQVTCPISLNKVNENTARLNALYTIIFTIIGLITSNPLFALFLAGDFAIRAFTFNGYSPIKFLSKKTGILFKIPQKLTDASPKRFAAGMGFAFSILIFLFQVLHLETEVYLSAGTLLICAFLESAFSFCLGCITYTYFVLPFRRGIRQKEV